MSKVCKYCGSLDVRKITKHKKGNKTELVDAEICNFCFAKLISKVPLTFTKEFLYEQHVTSGKSFLQISEEVGITLSKVKNWAKRYGIKEIEKEKSCKYCGSSNVRKTIRKGKGKNKGKILVVYNDYCTDCFYKIREKIPLSFTKEFLYDQAINEKKSFKQIAEENILTLRIVKSYAKKWKIEEIKRCKYCGTFENLVIRKYKNQCKEWITIRNICVDCLEIENEKRRQTIKSSYDVEIRKEAAKKVQEYYIDDPEKKKIETEKRKSTWDNKPQEEIDEWVNKIKVTKANQSPEEKAEISKKVNDAKKRNGTDRNYIADIGKFSQECFISLDQKLKDLNLVYEKFQYGIKGNKGEKRLRYEKMINVQKVSKKYKSRFLDSYLEINDRKIAFEFDEKRHENMFNEDLEREQEISFVKPILEIYRIKEKYWKENPEQVIEDLVEIIKSKDAKTHYSYLNCIQLQKNNN